MKDNWDNIKGQNILVVGMGKSGIAATQALVKLGAKVFVQDLRGEECFDPGFISYLKEKNVTRYFNEIPTDLDRFNMLILSPGVDPNLPFIREAKEKGAEIIGELEIAFRVGQCNYVAITGTNGKTTTTTLVGEIFREDKKNTRVVGNIGVAVISESMNSEASQWLITETSSFQLETIKYFKPHISAILNIKPDHLNRHKTMENYEGAKARIFENQGEEDFLIYNYDDKSLRKLVKKASCKKIPFSRVESLDCGAFVEGENIVFLMDGKKEVICSLDDINLVGGHNVENVLAAVAISRVAGISGETIRRAIKNFMGVEHRIEYWASIDGVKYYNDSKGTNVDATVTAIKGFGKNVILIAGGDGKGQDFTDLAKVLQGRVKSLILLGKDGKTIGKAAEKEGFNNISYCKDMAECVAKAAEVGKEGDVVLLSPACASWDMYKSYEQRGKHFKDLVSNLEA